MADQRPVIGGQVLDDVGICEEYLFPPQLKNPHRQRVDECVIVRDRIVLVVDAPPFGLNKMLLIRAEFRHVLCFLAGILPARLDTGHVLPAQVAFVAARRHANVNAEFRELRQLIMVPTAAFRWGSLGCPWDTVSHPAPAQKTVERRVVLPTGLLPLTVVHESVASGTTSPTGGRS